MHSESSLEDVNSYTVNRFIISNVCTSTWTTALVYLDDCKVILWLFKKLLQEKDSVGVERHSRVRQKINKNTSPLK